ncbi:MAG: hypothetical protein FJY98_00375 [Candidatus Liptonbacteria bacterium]|nr:hypothetical protein [Candidatus Liptonbacteria bacterium]
MTTELLTNRRSNIKAISKILEETGHQRRQFLRHLNLRHFPDEHYPLINGVVSAGFAAEPFAGLDTEKQDERESHRAVSGEGDAIAQQVLLTELSAAYPDAEFLLEEDTSPHAKCLPKQNPEGILQGRKIVGDPIDSSTRFGGDMSQWCTAAGMLQDGHVVGGAIFAPTMNGGLLVTSHKGKGVVVVEKGGQKVLTDTTPILPREVKKSVVLLGVDTLQYPAICNFIPKVTTAVRGVYTSGSGILGLALVAAGRAQAIFQTPQRIWDIIPGICALREAGRTVLFYRRDPQTGLPTEVGLDFQAFCYDRPNRLGIIAGDIMLVGYLAQLLQEAGPLLKADESLKD